MPDSVRATFDAVANGLERHGCDVRQALDLDVGASMATDKAVYEAIRSLWILLEVERTRLRLAEEAAKTWREVAERFERGELTPASA